MPWWIFLILEYNDHQVRGQLRCLGTWSQRSSSCHLKSLFDYAQNASSAWFDRFQWSLGESTLSWGQMSIFMFIFIILFLMNILTPKTLSYHISIQGCSYSGRWWQSPPLRFRAHHYTAILALNDQNFTKLVINQVILDKYRRQIDIVMYQLLFFLSDTSLCLFGDDMQTCFQAISCLWLGMTHNALL